jgi:hypothetical protein
MKFVSIKFILILISSFVFAKGQQHLRRDIEKINMFNKSSSELKGIIKGNFHINKNMSQLISNLNMLKNMTIDIKQVVGFINDFEGK